MSPEICFKAIKSVYRGELNVLIKHAYFYCFRQTLTGSCDETGRIAQCSLIKTSHVLYLRVNALCNTYLYVSCSDNKGLNPFPDMQILDSSKLKDFADDNFK